MRSNRLVKIKIEVDFDPPRDFDTEEKLLIRPFSFYVKCFTPPCLFAGKLHALLFRKWKNRVKGRDWYDLEWYIKRGIAVDVSHFLERAVHTGDWPGKSITSAQIMDFLREKINSVSFTSIKADIIRFIKDDSVIDIWSAAYFTDLVKKLKFENFPTD